MVLKSNIFLFNNHFSPSVVFMLLLCLNGLAFAQFTPGADPNPRERLELGPLNAPPDSPLLAPTSPQVNSPNFSSSDLSAQSQIQVTKFDFQGNKKFSQQQLEEIVAKDYPDYRTRPISAEELQQIKNQITAYYIENGFINSGAIIPEQQVQNGIVKIEIIEGQLSQVTVENTEKLHEDYIKDRLKFSKGEALNINDLQERLQLLQQDPLLRQINAELGPGVELGEGILKIKVYEKRPWETQFTFNNHRSPSVGAYRGQVEFWHHNLTGSLFNLFGQKQQGRGDNLYLRYGLTQGLNDYSIGYTFPLLSLSLNRYHTSLNFSYDQSDSEVIEEPFKQIDVESKAKTWAISFTQPWWKTPSQESNTSLKLEKRFSQTFLLGRPFPFSPGVEKDGESHISVVRLSQDWLNRNRSQVLAARMSFNFGVDLFDATINEGDLPDSKFFTWLGQFQWVRRLDFMPSFGTGKLGRSLQDSQLLFRIDLQLADQDLLPLEKFSVGGASSVRGYRDNFLTRDNGGVSSLEWRLPVYTLSVPKISETPEDGELQLVTFFDYGWAKNKNSDTPDPKQIYSWGLGMRWSPSSNIQAEIYKGVQMKDIEDPPEYDLQDDGIHFEISLKY